MSIYKQSEAEVARTRSWRRRTGRDATNRAAAIRKDGPIRVDGHDGGGDRPTAFGIGRRKTPGTTVRRGGGVVEPAICANALDLAGARPTAPYVAAIRIEACLENGGTPGDPYVLVRRVGSPAGHEWPRMLMPLGYVAGLVGSGQVRLEPGADERGDGKSGKSGSPGVDIATTTGRKGRRERAAGRAARSWRRFEICVMLDHHGEPNSVHDNAAALKRFWPPETIGQYGPPPAPETLRKWRIEHRRLYRLRARMIA